MSLPNLLKENERNDDEWKRKARDLINQLTRRLLGQSATVDRPSNPVQSQMHYDLTLLIPIWWDGTQWTNAMGSPV